MKYRVLDADGDYVFGLGSGNFLQDTPATVAQAVYTSLRLLAGELFFAVDQGLPYFTEILGYHSKSDIDTIFTSSILNVDGVNQITAFASNVDPSVRVYSFTATIDTIYGSTNLAATATGTTLTVTL